MLLSIGLVYSREEFCVLVGIHFMYPCLSNWARSLSWDFANFVAYGYRWAYKVVGSAVVAVVIDLGIEILKFVFRTAILATSVSGWMG